MGSLDDEEGRPLLGFIGLGFPLDPDVGDDEVVLGDGLDELVVADELLLVEDEDAEGEDFPCLCLAPLFGGPPGLEFGDVDGVSEEDHVVLPPLEVDGGRDRIGDRDDDIVGEEFRLLVEAG